MKITIEGTIIRIHGERKVDLLIHASTDQELDRFILSLCYDGFDHGWLPMIEVAGGHIVVYSNGERKLLK